jgi:hypothetical protein
MRNRLCPSGEVNPPTVRRGFGGMRKVISIEERSDRSRTSIPVIADSGSPRQL